MPKLTPYEIYQRNLKFSIPGISYTTTLPSDKEEEDFLKWVKDNKIPYDPTEDIQDYDMRGYYAAMKAGDPRATFDKKRMHFPDIWKTPFHESFSNESIYANPKTAPKWYDNKLITPNGKIIFQE